MYWGLEHSKEWGNPYEPTSQWEFQDPKMEVR